MSKLFNEKNTILDEFREHYLNSTSQVKKLIPIKVIKIVSGDLEERYNIPHALDTNSKPYHAYAKGIAYYMHKLAKTRNSIELRKLRKDLQQSKLWGSNFRNNNSHHELWGFTKKELLETIENALLEYIQVPIQDTGSQFFLSFSSTSE